MRVRRTALRAARVPPDVAPATQALAEADTREALKEAEAEAVAEAVVEAEVEAVARRHQHPQGPAKAHRSLAVAGAGPPRAVAAGAPMRRVTKTSGMLPLNPSWWSHSWIQSPTAAVPQQEGVPGALRRASPCRPRPSTRRPQSSCPQRRRPSWRTPRQTGPTQARATGPAHRRARPRRATSSPRWYWAGASTTSLGCSASRRWGTGWRCASPKQGAAHSSGTG
mmetsp:Transcript_47540/g.140425  ORF Transcript_47540/g.140425 Transcript_47540/m.140425 type:complete len:224 (-) Transcript_47540:78-749(-)